MKAVSIDRTVNESALELLKEMKIRVESGEIVSLALASVTNDGGIDGDVSDTPNGIMMWAAIQHVANYQYSINVQDDDE